MSDEPRSPALVLLDELPTASRDAPTPTPDYNAIHGRFLPGTVFGERYRIIELLGRGGRARSTALTISKLGQAVALKFFPRWHKTKSRRARLRSEVRLARQISHPNVCRVFDIGQSRRTVLPLHGIRRRRRSGLGPEKDGPSFPSIKLFRLPG